MRQSGHPFWVVAGVWASAALAAGILFGPVWLDPGRYLFASSGDGIKAYFGLAWYLQHGEGLINYAFQYPVGNHIAFMDQNLVFTGFFRLLGIRPATETVVAVVNLCMMLSFLPAVWLMFLLLRRAHLPTGYALAAALVLVFMSPPVLRMGGHYSLANAFFFPAMWLLTLNWFEEKKPLISLFGWCLLGVLFAFMHPYLALVSSAFFLCFALVWIWQKRPVGSLVRRIATFAAPFIPVAVYWLWTTLSYDGLSDAVSRPYGGAPYRAGFESIFLPSHAPFNAIWSFFLKAKVYDFEGYAYVGFPGLLVFLWLVSWMGWKIWRKKARVLSGRIFPAHLGVSVLAATLLLLFATATPLRWIPAVWDELGPLRQFRAVGRFAWPFFYTFVVLAAHLIYVLYRHMRKKGMATFGRVLLVASVGSWALYALSAGAFVRAIFLPNKTRNLPDWTADYPAALNQMGVKLTDYQAIFPLPYFHHGSEKVALMEPAIERPVMAMALQTGLSITGNLSSRVPLTHLKNSLQWVSHPLLPKPYLSQLKDQRPFLLAYLPGYAYSPGELALIERAQPLGQAGPVMIASLRPAAWDSAVAQTYRQTVVQFHSLKSWQGLMHLSDPASWAFFDGFGDGFAVPGKKTRIIGRRPDTLYRAVLPPKPDGGFWTLETSVWIRVEKRYNYLPALTVRRYDGQRLVHKMQYPLLATRDVWGNWICGRAWIEAWPNERLEITVRTDGAEIDHFLMVPKGISVAYPTDSAGLWMWNNYPLRVPDSLANVLTSSALLP